jgi:hypothetical protein
LSNEANEAAVASDMPVAEAAVPALDGQWSVAAIDGKPVSAGSAMTATFAAGRVNIASGCIRRGWTYTQKGNVVSFATDPGSSANCGGGVPSGEQEIAYAALERASIAIFDKDGKEANLSGTGGNLTLRRR